MNDATTVALSPETVLQHMKQNGEIGRAHV